jgi:predicted permease
MDTLWKDLRFAGRMLRRTPGVTAAAVLALALGIGANSAIFSVVDGVLLRPLPYADSQSLLVLHGNFPNQGMRDMAVSYPEYKDLLEHARTFANVGTYAQGDASLSGEGMVPERIVTGVASATFFPTLGVQPILGRNFTKEEEFKGSDQVALLDYGLWQRRYNADPSITAKTILLDGLPYRVIGVLPPGFRIDQPALVWVPLSTSLEMTANRGAHFLITIGRLRAGVTPTQLGEDLAAVARYELDTFGTAYNRAVGWSWSFRPLLDAVVGDVRPALFVLLGAVGFVLLIACANVANLMLARAAARHREMAIRTALGAGRARLVRQLLTESLILSLIGGGLGLLLAVWGVDGIVALSPDALPRAREIGLDGRVLAFTIGVTLMTGLAFGLVPALSASRPDLHDALKDGTRGTSSGRGRLRKALVVTEVALSLVLLVGTGLMARSFLRLRQVDPGFRADHVLSLRVSLPTPNGPSTDADKERYVSYFARAATRLAALPGVEAAGAITLLPFDGDSNDNSFDVEGYVPRSPGDKPDNEMREVAGDYFSTLRIPLVRGRLLDSRDVGGAPLVAVINQTMAQRYWPNQDPIGKRIKLHSRSAPEWRTIVGIVGDVRGFGLDVPARAEMYFPHAQVRRSAGLALVARTTGDPAALATTVRAALGEIDANQPVFAIQPLETLLSASLAQRRLALMLMLIFGGAALLLAAVGIYGVMSYTVAQRTQEIGIRVALGAQPGDVLGMVVRDGMLLVAAGLGLGLGGALGLTRLVSSLLFGVSATDVVTYAVIALILAAVALAATVIPARRATRVDPMLALRVD